VLIEIGDRGDGADMWSCTSLRAVCKSSFTLRT